MNSVAKLRFTKLNFPLNFAEFSPSVFSFFLSVIMLIGLNLNPWWCSSLLIYFTAFVFSNCQLSTFSTSFSRVGHTFHPDCACALALLSAGHTKCQLRNNLFVISQACLCFCSQPYQFPVQTSLHNHSCSQPFLVFVFHYHQLT